jgi:serine-type D-Ala-D-Ala carboxypeptidase (penicillin-binding protein 5/6)
MKRLLAALAAVALAGPALVGSAPGQTHDTPARAAMVVDLTSGATLLEKEADQPLPPASMSKLMTLYMAFEALDRGLISMDDEFRTSARAAAMGGSKMFIRDGELVSVENLLRGIVVQSGNDAAVALAEALAGTEEAFAARMNERAADIGLTNSYFANATGWPHPDQHMSMRDLVRLASLLIERFSQYYPMFAETQFGWDGVEQRNRNPLLGLGIGADGLKTGHTEEAGYGLVASAKRGERRVVMAIAGLDSAGARSHEAERLINWAFRAFETRQLYTAGEGLVEAPVWIGATPRVMLAPERDVTVTAPYGNIEKAALKIRYDAPVEAPVEAGQRIGSIEIAVPDLAPFSVPLVATAAVERGGFVARVQAAAELMLGEVIPADLIPADLIPADLLPASLRPADPQSPGPQSAGAQPAAPQPAGSQPASAQSAARQSASPQSASPQPASPQPG